MSTVKSSSKKRKHDSISSEGVVVKLAAPTSVVGPLLVSYPALQAPSSTPFKCYANKKAKNESKQPENAESINEQNLLVVGETEDVEFISNEGESKKATESGCSCTQQTNIYVTYTPGGKNTVYFNEDCESLKKNVLGETFGTKKAKANIRAQERNRVDVSAMQGVMDHLQQGIDKGAVGLMTSEEAKVEADKNRLIPPFDITAIDPEDSYPLHNIIPEVEWKALSISAFDQAAGPGERKALLPFKWSNWINSHINATCADTHSPKRRKKNLKLLLYISAMFAFRRAVEFKKNISKDDLTEKLSAVPSIIVEGLISRFTETSRGSSGYTSTSATQTKLLSYMFALCLKVDNFASDTSHIAHDLNKPLAEINTLFRSLGCKIGLLGDKERAKLGLSDKDATDKRAILNAPLTFPKPRLRRK
ncbi:hypothetical protein C0989_003104 [Termitomyces sp. Mn162]|nr:hypothetical protein C0989_003104 [Termitomyces sp. Mn162]